MPLQIAIHIATTRIVGPFGQMKGQGFAVLFAPGEVLAVLGLQGLQATLAFFQRMR
jgi:hypothetical protein